MLTSLTVIPISKSDKPKAINEPDVLRTPTTPDSPVYIAVSDIVGVPIFDQVFPFSS